MWWNSKPDRRGVIPPLAPPRGFKSESWDVLDRYVEQERRSHPAGCVAVLGAVGHWVGVAAGALRAPSLTVFFRETEGKGALFHASEAGNAPETPNKQAPASSSGSNR